MMAEHVQLTREQIDQCVKAAVCFEAGDSSKFPDVGGLAVSLPRISVSHWRATFGKRIVFWPCGINKRFRVSILSSRLGKRKDLKSWWFDALRTTLLRCDFENDCLCVVDKTAAAEFVARGSELFGLPRIRFYISEQQPVDADGLADWIEACQQQHSDSTSDESELETAAYVSPEFLDADEAAATSLEVPVADQMLAAAGERLVVLSSRSSGNVERTVMDRLQSITVPSPIVLLATADEAPAPCAKLIDSGAVPWFLTAPEACSNAATPNRLPSESSVRTNVPTDGPLERPNEWLCHWTRANYGPWLDQPSEDFMDELILGCESADRSAFAALMRIIGQKKLLATVATSGEPPTVSFTAVPIAEFRARRIFRKHRQRFDFEPWGVAVRKDYLLKRGCRAVTYLEATETKQQSGDQPVRHMTEFTQRRFDRSGTVDWSVEQEWRLPGEVQLDHVSPNDLCYFVASELDAERLRRQCESRVIVVPDVANSSLTKRLPQ